MFCPYCGSHLSMLESGKAQCEATGAVLSEKMSRLLEYAFCGAAQPAWHRSVPSEIGGDWFCPKCSIRMKEEEGKVLCPKCEKPIDAYVQELIEHNPHP